MCYILKEGLRKLRLPKKDNGFILFEVILSLSILSLGLILILGSFEMGLKAVRVSEASTQATFLLNQKITEIEVNPSQFYIEKSEGIFEEAPKFTWKAEIKEVSEMNLKEVKIAVEWQEGTVDLVTYL